MGGFIRKGERFGYHEKASKLHIIVKEKYQDIAKQIFQGSKITITTEGHQHLGSVIGGLTIKESYIKNLWTPDIQRKLYKRNLYKMV